MRARLPRAAIAASLLLVVAAPAAADVVVDTDWGFGGEAVGNSPTPIRIELKSNETEAITVSLLLRPPAGSGGVGGEGAPILMEAFLAPGAGRRLTVPVRSAGGWNDAAWRLRIQTDRRTLIRHGTVFEDGTRLDVEVGGGPLAGNANRTLDPRQPVLATLQDDGRLAWLKSLPPPEDGNAGARTIDGRRFGLIQAFSVTGREAPTTWIAWEGADAVVWHAPRPGEFENDAAADSALRWAERGGRLVVVLTPEARVPPSSRLGAALPGIVRGWSEAPPGELLGATVGRDPVPVTGATIPVADLADMFGTVVRRLPDGRPLVVERDWGLGTLAVVTWDVSRIASAPAEPRCLLAAALVGPQAWSDAEHRWGGVDADLEPMINHMRRRFLRAPPLALLVLGLVLYVLAIGPLDYFMLKKRKALRRTVYTFPAIVVGFTVLAWGGSFLLFGGDSGGVRVAWVDFATAGSGDADVVRGVDVVGIYSPTGTTVDLAWDADDAYVDGPWLAHGARQWHEEVTRLDGAVRIGPDGLPRAAMELPLRSFRTAQGRWSAVQPQTLDARWIREDGRLSIEVHNTLGTDLRDPVVVYGGEAVLLTGGGPLAAGKTVRVAVPDAPPPERGVWRRMRNKGSGRILPWTFTGPGLMGGSRDDEFFVPDESGGVDADVARERMARAAMGATFTGLGGGGDNSAAPTRVLARQGVDLSRAALEGRPIVLGWCDRDPLGRSPEDLGLVSEIHVVRRVLPRVPTDAEEGR